MSNPKLKSENYNQLGGINSKYSPYVLSPLEFLNISNFDFQTPGSLTQRWGSTQYIGQTFPGRINSLFEYSKLSGASYIVASYSGGIFFGATTGNYQGISFTYLGVTTFATLVIQDVTFIASTQNKFTPTITWRDNIRQVLVPNGGQGNFYENPIVQSDNILSEVTFADWMYAADGNKFYKFNGTTTYFVTPPPAISQGVSFKAGATTGLGLGATGSYAFYASYVDSQGFEGNIWPIGYVDSTNLGNGGSVVGGGSMLAIAYNIATPFAYDIASINIYSYWNGASIVGSSLWTFPYTFLLNAPTSGSTITQVSVGSTIGGIPDLIANNGKLPDSLTNSYQPIGITYVSTNGTIETDIVSYFPRYLDVFQNRLFSAGFSLTPSTVWFSEVGLPQAYQADFNFEVRTNDSDVVTCLKAYSTRLYIFKNRSFHVLSGDSPNNFFLQEISNQYGCVNNRCAVTYEDTLVFLDQKGVMMYTGANITHLSQKIQPTFDTMNYAAAVTTAIMVHDKLRNQILCSIPTNGATLNNITMVYDYVAGAWTSYKGQMPSSYTVAQGYNNTRNAFYGSYSGTINWYGPSFLADNGNAATLYFKTRFLHDMGESIEKQFRRLYINADQASSTFVMPINFFQDYGSSIVKSTTFVTSAFQNRIDYGIAAKSLAYELSSLGASSPLRIHGFTIESRLQRRV